MNHLVGHSKSLDGSLVDWGLTALSTQFRSYRTIKIELYCKYYNLIHIISWSKVTYKNITIIVELDRIINLKTGKLFN